MAIVKKKEAPVADQPDIRLSGDGHAAGDAHRIVAAELRHVDVGPLSERRPIAEIAEAPDRAAILQFEIRTAQPWLAVGVERDRIVTADGEPGVPVDHDPFGRTAGGSAEHVAAEESKDKRKNRDRGARFLPLLPCCGHSFGERSA
jgi:hypothetical protein